MISELTCLISESVAIKVIVEQLQLPLVPQEPIFSAVQRALGRKKNSLQLQRNSRENSQSFLCWWEIIILDLFLSPSRGYGLWAQLKKNVSLILPGHWSKARVVLLFTEVLTSTKHSIWHLKIQRKKRYDSHWSKKRYIMQKVDGKLAAKQEISQGYC